MSKIALRILIVAAVLTVWIIYAGALTGEWRGALVTEIHVLAVAFFAYMCLRPQPPPSVLRASGAQQRGARRT